MNAQVVWTDLSPQEIATRLEQDYQVKVSKSVVLKLLKKHQFRRRKAQKQQTLKSVPQRDEQFGRIAVFLAEYRSAGYPIISFDKKKNLWEISIGKVVCTPKTTKDESNRSEFDSKQIRRTYGPDNQPRNQPGRDCSIRLPVN